MERPFFFEDPEEAGFPRVGDLLPHFLGEKTLKIYEIFL